jgi:hypothetical protein
MPSQNSTFNRIIQILLPFVAILGWLATSLKHPEYGLIFAFFAQLLWLHVTYRGWKQAQQVGGFVTTLFEIAIISFGIINYWLLTS